MKQNLKLMSSRCGQDNHFVLVRRLCLVSSHSAMSGFSVFTGAEHLLASLPFSHRPPHPEADFVGAVPLTLFGKPFIWAIERTNYKHEHTGSGFSYSGRNGQWSLPY